MDWTVGNTHFGRYDSADEFVSRMQPENAKPASQHGYDYWHNHSADNWCGFPAGGKFGRRAIPAATRLIREGWPEGGALVERIGRSLSIPTSMGIRRRMRWTDQGDDLDMQRVYSGDLDRAWRRPGPRLSSAPSRIRLVVDAVATGDVDAGIMSIKGAATVRLADALTEAGFSVQVVSAWKANAQGKSFILGAVTKPYDQPVDIATLAATTANPVFFRVLGHAWGPVVEPTQTSGGYYTDRISTEEVDTCMGADDGAMTFIAAQRLKNFELANEWVAQVISDIADRINGLQEDARLAA